MLDTNRYTIVERAGYVGERDVKTLDDYRKARRWMDDNYSPEEIQSEHIEIALDLPDGSRTYEV